jgi:drug/metabolite transporter (DMT)-like permease
MNKLGYLLIPLISMLLITAQASWGHFIKTEKPFSGSVIEIIGHFITSPLFWFGALLYGLATIAYFLSLSQYQFFMVQTTVTALAILLSVALSKILFHEVLTIANIIGILCIMAGVYLVFPH